MCIRDRRGATRIIAMSRHEDRAALAREFGATDIVPERGQEAIDKVLEMTGGYGADVYKRQMRWCRDPV